MPNSIILTIKAMKKRILIFAEILCVFIFVGCRPGITKNTYKEALRSAFLIEYGQAVDIVDYQVVNGRNTALVQLCDNRDLYFRISTNEYNEDLQDNYALSYLEYLIKKDIDSNINGYYSDYYVYVEIQDLKPFPPGVDFRKLSVDELIDYVDEEGSINISFYIDKASLTSAFPYRDNKQFVDDCIVSKNNTGIHSYLITSEELKIIKDEHLYE